MTVFRTFLFTRFAVLASAFALCLSANTAAIAQGYPAKPVKIVLSTGAGGVTDIVFRSLGDEMGKQLGQPVLIENKPGANGLIAAQAVKSAQPDGYTLYGGDLTKVSSVFMINSMDAPKELTPVTSVLSGDFFIYVPANTKITNLKELAAFAKANPGGIRTSTVATYLHMIFSLVAKRAGFQIENIPYKTSAETIQALYNGDVHATLNAAGGFVPHVQSGKLRVIATLGAKRSPLFPDVPTAMEQGVPVNLFFEFGIWAPPGAPQEVVNKVRSAVADALKVQIVADRIRTQGMVPSPSTPDELVARHKASDAINGEAAALIGFKPQ